MDCKHLLKPPVKSRILFFVTEDWYFCSHRLPLAIAASQEGYDVAVVTRVRNQGEIIKEAGIRLIPMELSRGGRNPLTEWLTIWRFYRICRREKPDLVHNVALKPVLYGSIAARLAGVPHIVNALAGLGHIFADEQRAGTLRRIVKWAFRGLLNSPGGKVIVQNPDDYRRLVTDGLLNPDRAVLILGSGVNLDDFKPSPEPPGAPVVVMASRLLWDKGAGEYAEAARLIKNQGIEARFLLAGEADNQNHSAIPETQIKSWHQSGVLEWLGQRDDIANIFRHSHIVCLPSYYGEGVPKVLLEAAAAGKPIVTTDMPGCREVVMDGENGLLVAPKNAESLAAALTRLLLDPPSRISMGKRGRRLAEEKFGLESIIAQTLDVYSGLLADRSPDHQQGTHKVS